jgi:hypothetical protein
MISSVTTDPPLVADVEFGTNCFSLIQLAAIYTRGETNWVTSQLQLAFEPCGAEISEQRRPTGVKPRAPKR